MVTLSTRHLPTSRASLVKSRLKSDMHHHSLRLQTVPRSQISVNLADRAARSLTNRYLNSQLPTPFVPPLNLSICSGALFGSKYNPSSLPSLRLKLT